MTETLDDITPEKFLCPSGDCPAVLKTDRDTYIIVGKRVDPLPPDLAGRVGDGDTVVEIPAEILETAVATQSEEHTT